MSEIFKQSVSLGNASDYPWEASAGSQVYSWKPHEVVEIFAQKDYDRDDFGRPRKPAEGMEPRDGAGNIIKSAIQYVTKKGADLEGIVNHLMEKPGCPLFLVNHDAGDKEREVKSKANHLTYKLKECRDIMERWRTRVFAIKSSGGTTPHMPVVEFEADQFLVRHGASGSLSMKRFLCEEDGASFDYREDARAHLVHPLRYPQFADEWQKHIKDTQPELPIPVKFVDGPQVKEYNATTKSLMAEALAAEIVIPQDLLERVDSGSRDALREALELLAGGEDEDPESKPLKPWQIAQAAKAAKKAAEKAADKKVAEA